MSYFRSKPSTVEAWRFEKPYTGMPAWLQEAFSQGTVYYQGGGEPYLTIEATEGVRVRVPHGAWVLRRPCGELYPCGHEAFLAAWEPAPEAEPSPVAPRVLP